MIKLSFFIHNFSQKVKDQRVIDEVLKKFITPSVDVLLRYEDATHDQVIVYNHCANYLNHKIEKQPILIEKLKDSHDYELREGKVSVPRTPLLNQKRKGRAGQAINQPSWDRIDSDQLSNKHSTTVDLEKWQEQKRKTQTQGSRSVGSGLKRLLSPKSISNQKEMSKQQRCEEKFNDVKNSNTL